MELSHGVVRTISFQNTETGFSVVKILFEKEDKPITCVGIMPFISKGEMVTVCGNWVMHQRFGRQFAVDSYSMDTPTTSESIMTMLTSGIVSNIGPVRAKNIVDRFGTETLEILDKSPYRLCEIPGIGKKTVQKIINKWGENERLRRLLIFLQKFDISYSLVLRVFKKYGDKAQEKVSQNPYILCEDIWGIGFIKADAIAQKMGFFHDSFKRIRAGLLFILNEASHDGHSCLPKEILVKKAAEVLQTDEEQIVFSIDHLISDNKLIRDEEFIYYPYLYYAEKSVAEKLSEKLKEKQVDSHSVEEIHRWIDGYEITHNWKADPLQRQAIVETISQPCQILTGGPGTGKTTVLKLVVAYFIEKKRRVCCAAPTGRAAQRMKDITGAEAQTLHRLLEYKPQGGENGYRFNRNEDNPLAADIIIIDEVSMIDVQLMASFCNAVAPSTQILFVGDNNQLPSVGAGNVLSDIIKSNIVPYIHLTTVFRQAQKSRIIAAAHEINGGTVPRLLNSRNDDCFFIEQSDAETALDTIVDLVSRRLPDSYRLNPLHEIQVLSPMNKGLLGVQNINRKLQEVLKSSQTRLLFGNQLFYMGDKVMQTRNNYGKNIFNGDIGFIAEIMEDNGIIVDFQGNCVTYDMLHLDELVPAYCISIHKSQGSEFKAVIVPLFMYHYIMLQRNLIYTAITRAKRLFIFIGDKKALRMAVQTDKQALRYSQLDMRLKKKVP